MRMHVDTLLDVQSISLSASVEPVLGTKGYVVAGTLHDTPYDMLHGSSSTTPRSIYLTSWMYAADGTQSEYFRNEPFRLNANGEGDGLWHHPQPLFWPLGCTMDFLGYSCTVPFPGSSVKWGYGNSCSRVTLVMDGSYTQDDVLFTCSTGCSATAVSGNVPLNFSHSQAWIEFRLHSSSAATASLVRIHRIVLSDIFTEGQLTVTHPFGFPEGEWDFRMYESRDTEVDDSFGVNNTLVTEDVSYYDMLLPEQRMKDIVLYYSLGDSDRIMPYRFTLPVATWRMGSKYVYDIIMSPDEMFLVPSVEVWDDGGSHDMVIG